MGLPGALLGRGRTADVLEWEAGSVVKLLRPGLDPVLIEQEGHIARAVTGFGLPSPRYLGTVAVDGRPGIIFERLDGPTMRDVVVRSPLRCAEMARAFAMLHAAVHSRSGENFPSQKDRIERSIDHAGEHLPAAFREAALERVAVLPVGDRLCHGDFHPENVHVTARGPLVIDWMEAGSGRPAADVARTAYLIVDSAVQGMGGVLLAALEGFRRAFRDLYVREYLQLTGVSEDEILAWRLPVLAARLAEDVESERLRLLHLIELEVAR